VARITNDSGIPVPSDEHSLTAAPNGPTLLQDAYVAALDAGAAAAGELALSRADLAEAA
jgi:hypothetical protein